MYARCQALRMNLIGCLNAGFRHLSWQGRWSCQAWKIKLEKWDIYESGDYKAENAWSGLEDAPEIVRGLVASPVTGGLIVQFNSDVVYTKLSELSRPGSDFNGPAYCGKRV